MNGIFFDAECVLVSGTQVEIGLMLELGKVQSFRKASIAAGVLRRMHVDHCDPLFSLVQLDSK